MQEESSSLDIVDRYEELIEGLLQNKYGHSRSFLEPELLNGLRANLLGQHVQDSLQQAGIGKQHVFTQNRSIRGDKINWIEKDSQDPFEQAFNQQIEDFIQYLNRTCYTSINDYEFHYACYEAGTFYQRHRDQFKSDNGRVFSVVIYLNLDWQEVDEGQLVLFLEDEEISIPPDIGTCVFFRSEEIEHEVRAPRRSRMSITGWLKSSNQTIS